MPDACSRSGVAHFISNDSSIAVAVLPRCADSAELLSNASIHALSLSSSGGETVVSPMGGAGDRLNGDGEGDKQGWRAGDRGGDRGGGGVRDTFDEGSLCPQPVLPFGWP